MSRWRYQLARRHKRKREQLAEVVELLSLLCDTEETRDWRNALSWQRLESDVIALGAEWHFGVSVEHPYVLRGLRCMSDGPGRVRVYAILSGRWLLVDHELAHAGQELTFHPVLSLPNMCLSVYVCNMGPAPGQVRILLLLDRRYL